MAFTTNFQKQQKAAETIEVVTSEEGFQATLPQEERIMATDFMIEERIKVLEQKLQKFNESETLESNSTNQVKPEQLQTKLNKWVDQIEKQVKQMERKLTRKIKLLEESQNQVSKFFKRDRSSALLEEKAVVPETVD